MSEANDWAISLLEKEIQKRKTSLVPTLFLLTVLCLGLIAATLLPETVDGRLVFQGYSRGVITGCLGGFLFLYFMALVFYTATTDGLKKAVRILKEDDAE